MIQKDPSDAENNDRDEVIDLDEHQPAENYPDMEEDDDMDESGGEDEDVEAELRDDSTVTFFKHKEPIFCIAFNPVDNSILATGGQDDMAYVWTISDGSTILQCTGHKDSVTQVAFSSDGQNVATGDLAGLIQVWHLSSKQLIWSYEIGELEWMNWHFGTNVLFASDADGVVWFWKIPSGECKMLTYAGVKACYCCLLPNGSSLATGYSNGQIRLWNLGSSTVINVTPANYSHGGAITSMDVCSHQTLTVLASGGLDGKVNVYNPTNLKFITSFDLREESGGDSECHVETVSNCSSRPLIAAGTNTGFIFIIDIQNHVVRHQINSQASVTKVVWQPESPLLYVGDASGVVSLWDGRNGEPTAQFYGHSAEILNLAVAKQGVVFASCSEDTTAKVYVVSLDDAE